MRASTSGARKVWKLSSADPPPPPAEHADVMDTGEPAGDLNECEEEEDLPLEGEEEEDMEETFLASIDVEPELSSRTHGPKSRKAKRRANGGGRAAKVSSDAAFEAFCQQQRLLRPQEEPPSEAPFAPTVLRLRRPRYFRALCVSGDALQRAVPEVWIR
eukprot:RCo029062